MTELTGEVTITRMLDAPAELVFRAWTEGEHLAKWYAPEGFGVGRAESDAKEGGAFTIVMKGPDGAEYPLWGTYTEFDPPKKLVTAVTAAGPDGTPALDAVTTVTLIDHDGKTEMTVHERASALTPEAAPMLAGMEIGLQQSLRRLDDLVTGAIDRSIVLSRMLEAPRDQVFELWTSAEHLANWWGPNGFTLTTHEADIRPGGVWRFTMHGPDGVDYENRIEYEAVEPPSLLRFVHHGAPGDDDPPFRTTVTFDDFGGNTVLTMKSVFVTAEDLDLVLTKYAAREGGEQTLDRLVAYVATR
jgi:uncharacterized protein YndB with AHSA1/START domain